MKNFAQYFSTSLRKLACIGLLGLIGAGSAHAQTSPVANSFSLDNKKEEFLPVEQAFKLDASVSQNQLTLHWTIAPGYYLYQERFKFEPTAQVTLVPSFSQGITKFDEALEKEVVVFHDNATITFPLPAGTGPFGLQVTSQGCADAGLCYPPRKEGLQIDLVAGTAKPVDLASMPAPVALTEVKATQAQNTEELPKLWLLQAIVFAILGGMTLNLMPCVFPVLSLKVMSLAQADRKHMVHHGWAYTAGIIACFLLFAIILLIARAGGEAIGWGFQLQSPMVIVSLAYLFFVMGLSMSGMIHFGTSWMGAGQSLTEKSGMTGSFFTGVLAAVVASPCTAPFMGAALGFALTQPGIVSLLVFIALGFGMALPLLILCYVPALADRLPRPGAWMEILKEVLAFPLYITAIWLLWVLGNQAGVSTLITVCIGAVALAFAIWLYNHPGKGALQQLRRALILACTIVAFVLPWQLIQGGTHSSRWQPYSPESLSQLRAAGKPVFVNLTADWCITCLANERVALGTKDVEAAFDEMNVATLKGDWTNRDPRITELLGEYDRSGVPLYLWFPAGHQGKGILLPQLLTKSIVIDALRGTKRTSSQ